MSQIALVAVAAGATIWARRWGPCRRWSRGLGFKKALNVFLERNKILRRVDQLGYRGMGKLVSRRRGKQKKQHDQQRPLAVKAVVDQPAPEDPIVNVPPGWNGLVLDVLQQRRQQLLFALMVPGVEPDWPIS